jgi:RNA polymerase sigma-70 factor (ECF subfamily)
VLVLRDVLGLHAAEVSGMLDTTEDAVKGALKRARAAVEGVVKLLTDDAWLTMPPATIQYQGRGAIRAFMRAGWHRPEAGRHRLLETRANSQPAFGCYRQPLRTAEKCDRAAPAGRCVAVFVRNDG